MSLATSLSRILGYLRDSLGGALFGVGWLSDAFVVAFRVPNLLRDLLAEGALSSALVPALVHEEHERGKAAFWRLAALALNALIAVSGALVLLGWLSAPWLVDLLAPGFRQQAGQTELTVTLVRILFPFLTLMAMAAIFMAALNAQRRFAPGAYAPLFLNLTMIAFGLWAYGHPDWGMEAQVKFWAWGALAGGLAQCAFQVPFAMRLGFKPRWAWPFSDRAVNKLARQMLPAIVGQSATQLNLLISQVLASMLAAGSATYLYYGNRMMQLPLGVFGVAVATAALPELAAHHSRQDPDAFKGALGYGLRLVLFVSLPAAVGLIILANPIHVLLFRWGRLGLPEALLAAKASVAYAWGIVFFAAAKVLVNAFYARSEGRVAVWVGLGGVLLNIILNIALYKPLGFVGLALGSSLSALVQVLVLLYLMRRRLGRMLRQELLKDLEKVIVCAAAMGMVLKLALTGLNYNLDIGAALERSRVLWQTPLLIGLGLTVYLGLAHALKVNYLRDLWSRKRGVA